MSTEASIIAASPMSTEELVRRFEAHDLAPAEWDHQAHLRAIAWLCFTCGADVALDRFRAAVQGLNIQHSVPQTPTGGYHETLTRVYVRLTAATIADLPRPTDALAAEAAVVAALSDKAVVLRHYSRERILSPEARFGWVPPDLAPLPGEPAPGPEITTPARSGKKVAARLPAQGDGERRQA